MKYIIILSVSIFCTCGYRDYYITEINKEDKSECREIIRERLLRNKQFKKVFYKIKKECRKDEDEEDE